MNLFSKKLIRFSISSAINLLIKILISSLLSFFINSFLVNYLIVHVIILFTGFFNHSKLSFKKCLTWKTFFHYTKSVILFKLMDYVLTNLLYYFSLRNTVISILISTLLIFLVRFLILNKYVFNGD